jgi:hypothetical protein
VQVILERLEDRALPSLSGVAFGGLNYDASQGATPPDTIIAAGPNNIVEAVNQNILFASKANLPGSISGSVEAFSDFFAGMTHSTFGLSDIITDPSVYYDPAAGKWVISILDVDLQNHAGYLDVAVSANSDPTGSWTKFQLDLTDGHGPLIPGNAGLTLWGDFERLGSSATAYVWTVNMFSFSAGGIDQNSMFDHVQVIAVDKSNLANVHQVDLPSYDSTTGTIVHENLLPVRMAGATAADGQWFAEETNYGSSTGQASSLQLVHVANILTATPGDFVNFTGNVPLYHFTLVPDPSGGGHAWNNGDANASAVQRGSADLIQTNDTRIGSAVWRVVGGQQHLVLTQTVNSDADPGIAKARWYDFNTTAATDPTALVPLAGSGEINPGPGVFTYFPSADIDPAGDLGMTYLESSASEYLSTYAAGKGLSESAMEAGVLVAGGNSADTGPDGSPHRAGDYSGTAVDVNSAGVPVNSFWSANEYSNNGVWGTAMVSYTISAPPPPPGARVTASTPSGTAVAPVGSVVFTFSQAMDTTSFTPSADVDSFTFTPPSGSPIDLTGQITGYSWIDSTHLQVNFNVQSAVGSYRMVIGPQILTASGQPLDQNQNGLPGEVPADEYTASFTIPAGAFVAASTPSGTVAGPVSSEVFTFSQAMDTTSFAPSADVDGFTFTPPSGPAVDLTGQITGYSWIDSTHLQVNFNAQSAAGTYSLVIGPQILTTSGQPLDQNQNGTPGEVPADEYTASFSISAPNPTRNIEDFESPHTYHVVFPPVTFQSSSVAVHDGTFGLINHGGSDWIYRDDAAAQVREGDTISAWVQFHGAADGQANFAFGANSNINGSPLATYSLVLSADKHKLYIQENFFVTPLNSTLGTSAQNTTFRPNHWYRIQVTWGTNGSILGQLYDSDGTTLLNSVSATASLFSAGGIGFHATGHDKYWDTVTAFTTGGSSAHVVTGHGTGGHGSSFVLGVVLQSALPTPLTPPRFAELSAAVTGDPNHDWRLALTGNLGGQSLVAMLEAVKQQGPSHHGKPRGAHGLSAVEWATIKAVADALPDGFQIANLDG